MAHRGDEHTDIVKRVDIYTLQLQNLVLQSNLTTLQGCYQPWEDSDLFKSYRSILNRYIIAVDKTYATKSIKCLVINCSGSYSYSVMEAICHHLTMFEIYTKRHTKLEKMLYI